MSHASKRGKYKLKFKDEKLLAEFSKAPILLSLMLQDADLFCQENFDKELTVTRILGSIAGDSGVHADYRAIDCRDEYLGKRTFNESELKDLMGYINLRYYRNDGLLSVIHHSFQGMPYHLHFQIATLTKAYMR